MEDVEIKQVVVTKEGLNIFADVGTYKMSLEQLVDFLCEDGQMCSVCHDTLEEVFDGVDTSGNVERGVNTRKCPFHGEDRSIEV